jgi:hypothetical protein
MHVPKMVKMATIPSFAFRLSARALTLNWNYKQVTDTKGELQSFFYQFRNSQMRSIY